MGVAGSVLCRDEGPFFRETLSRGDLRTVGSLRRGRACALGRQSVHLGEVSGQRELLFVGPSGVGESCRPARVSTLGGHTGCVHARWNRSAVCTFCTFRASAFSSLSAGAVWDACWKTEWRGAAV